ncbi:ArnT family glycosyltransferase [Sphingomonas jatrophae]|uniref:Dolichyl-phosphate-mannose-protein mannosyltransferase n=1 Tax=Sphingomonas jatrophae TaxID=1166337 RepID=A0A1I6JS21_9SPHN|nr:glycosyltransferase family 39 protein [Sphingomonas jatrophae]SFR81753.1 Dolichyl-phosphate-mannose-protein mannosyltransferase [Sphingomonas jatrophae]
MGDLTSSHRRTIWPLFDVPRSRGAAHREWGVASVLAGILSAALAIRLVGVQFGLPALYDPDEGFFLITGLKLLSERTLNPGWFGHPGTVTIYLLALIEAGVIGFGILTGRFADVRGFGRALYTDPSLVVVPARLMIVAFGVAGVLLTYLLGRRVADHRVGLLAAALVALNPLHISLSQIVRTDIQASAFMLLSALAATTASQTGRLRAYLLAGVWLGVACATKWPAAAVMAGIGGACVLRIVQDGRAEARRQATWLVAGIATGVVTLLLVSPYLVLDHATLLSNLGGEAKPQHLGSTGGSLPSNLLWYVTHPLRGSFGVLGIALIGVGVVTAVQRGGAPAAVVLPIMLAFLVGISSQQLIWPRWIVAGLPFCAILAAIGLWRMVDAVPSVRARVSITVVLAVAVLLPMAGRAAAQARELQSDTRAIASAWLKQHAPPGSTVLIEHFAFDLIRQPWEFRYPAGDAGCLDPKLAARQRIRTAAVYQMRGNRSIVDIGTINPARLESCRADFAIFTDYDRYRGEGARYAAEISRYEALAAGGRLLLTVRPAPGLVGGPTVRVVRLGLRPRTASNPPLSLKVGRVDKAG